MDFAGQEIDLVDANYVVEWRAAGLALLLLRRPVVLSFVVGVAFVVVEAMMEDWTSSCCGKMSSNGFFLKEMQLSGSFFGSRLKKSQLCLLPVEILSLCIFDVH